MRPLLGALGVCEVTLFDTVAANTTGGAKAAATSGFDSVGGEGPVGICSVAPGPGVDVMLGSLTVAAGLSAKGCWATSFGSLSADAAGAAVGCVDCPCRF